MKAKLIGLAALAALACVTGYAADQAGAPAGAATQPVNSLATSSDANSIAVLAQLRLRANQDMSKGNYADALPLLQKISQMLSDQPDQLGPVLEEIRVCRRQLSGAATRPVIVPTVSATISEARTPHPLPTPGTVLDLPIKDLGNFDFDSVNGGNIPDDVKKLEGVKFRTTGYMIPLDQAERISEFALVPSLFACCYGQPPQIQHTLVIHCPKGKALSYFPDELTVEGTLHVQEQKDGGFIVSVFQIDATSVKPAPK